MVFQQVQVSQIIHHFLKLVILRVCFLVGSFQGDGVLIEAVWTPLEQVLVVADESSEADDVIDNVSESGIDGSSIDVFVLNSLFELVPCLLELDPSAYDF